MTKRQKKKAEKLKREAIHEMLDLALDINGLQKSKRDITGDHPTAFFYMSGHIGEVEVQVHTKGWYADEFPDIRVRARIDDDPSRAVQKLREVKAVSKERRV